MFTPLLWLLLMLLVFIHLQNCFAVLLSRWREAILMVGCFFVIYSNATSQEWIIMIQLVFVTISVLCNILLTFYFVDFQFLLGVWAKDLNSREDHVKRGVQGKLASATHSQTESYLKPLFRKLRKKVPCVETVKQAAEMLYIGCWYKCF